jgi:hypothetical protein
VQWGRRGVERIIQVVAIVQGTDKAVSAVEMLERRLSEEEKQTGVRYFWSYTLRNIGQKWRKVHPVGSRRAKPGRRKRR